MAARQHADSPPSPLLDLSTLAPDPAPSPFIERIERALILLAYFIEIDGDAHIPMYERFEAELHELKQKESTKERARRRLLATADQVARTRSVPDI